MGADVYVAVDVPGGVKVEGKVELQGQGSDAYVAVDVEGGVQGKGKGSSVMTAAVG